MNVQQLINAILLATETNDADIVVANKNGPDIEFGQDGYAVEFVAAIDEAHVVLYYNGPEEIEQEDNDEFTDDDDDLV